MSRRNRSFGYSKKYAQAWKSFTRLEHNTERFAHSLYRSVHPRKRRRKRNKLTMQATTAEWNRPTVPPVKEPKVPLSRSQKVIAGSVALLSSLLTFVVEALYGGSFKVRTVIELIIVFFAIYSAMCEVVRLCPSRSISNSDKNNLSEVDSSIPENVKLDTEEADLKNSYQPNPDWLGDSIPIRNAQDAQTAVPQLVKQLRDTAKILNTTADPSVFYPRWDFAIGRILLLEECSKYPTALKSDPHEAYLRAIDLGNRDAISEDMIHRAEEKYKAKIQSLKTKKARINWATKFHDMFNEFTPYMSDEQLSVLGESSARLLELADTDPLEE